MGCFSFHSSYRIHPSFSSCNACLTACNACMPALQTTTHTSTSMYTIKSYRIVSPTRTGPDLLFIFISLIYLFIYSYPQSFPRLYCLFNKPKTQNNYIVVLYVYLLDILDIITFVLYKFRTCRSIS